MMYTDLFEGQQLTILTQVGEHLNQDLQTIEKDWWVTQVLRVLFSLPYAEYMSFKGGTSLSKAWNLVDRFSEDIDLAIDRTIFNLDGEMYSTKIRSFTHNREYDVIVSKKFLNNFPVITHQIEKVINVSTIKRTKNS